MNRLVCCAVSDAHPPGFRRLKPGEAHTGHGEFFWVGDLAETADGFEGAITNESVHVEAVRKGQRIAFAKDEIADWLYEIDSRIRGFATFCPSIAHEDEAKRVAMMRSFGLTCD